MPPKQKKDFDENDLPQIDRTLVKVRLLGLRDRVQEVKSRLAKTKRRDVILITRERVIEFAETNGLYLNLDTWDPKKKVPEGVPTSMTPELKIDL